MAHKQQGRRRGASNHHHKTPGKPGQASAPRTQGPASARHAGSDAQAVAVTEVIAPVVEEQGLYLESVKVVSSGSSRVVRVTLDLPEDQRGSLGSQHLQEASRALSKALDDDDVVAGMYTLEVSTPGTSRPLTTRRHFMRARGRLVRLTLASGQVVTGRVQDVVGQNLVMEHQGDAGQQAAQGVAGSDPASGRPDGVIEMALADIVKGLVQVEMNRIDHVDLDDLDDLVDDDLVDDDLVDSEPAGDEPADADLLVGQRAALTQDTTTEYEEN